MPSLLLRTAIRLIVPLQFVVSLVLLFRGHNEPGGGFIGGLTAASAVALYGLAYGWEKSGKLLPIPPAFLIGLGFLAAAFAGIIALVAGDPFLTGIWSPLEFQSVIAGKIKLGSPILFDIGIYLIVVGSVLLAVFSMAEEEI